MTVRTSSTMRRLRPRTTIVSGAALGMVVGASVYGGVSSAAQPEQVAFKANVPVALAPLKATTCTGTAKLEQGVCVIHVVRTVSGPPAAGAVAGTAAPAAAAPVAGIVPASTVRPAAAGATPAVTVAPNVRPVTPVAARAAAPVKAAAPAPVPAPVAAPAPKPVPKPGTTPVPTPVPTAAS
jgi:hypothetical protein